MTTLFFLPDFFQSKPEAPLFFSFERTSQLPFTYFYLLFYACFKVIKFLNIAIWAFWNAAILMLSANGHESGDEGHQLKKEEGASYPKVNC